MIGTRRLLTKAGLVRMLCALSLLLVAFAHRPLSLDATAAGYSAAEVAAYVLPDGTLPDLCLDGSKDGQHSAGNNCEACRITSSADLPLPIGGYVIARFEADTGLTVPQDVGPTRPAWRASASPRGPPSLKA